MSIIVTGAAGFIGSAYITYLNKVEPNKKIIAVDRDNIDSMTARNLNNLKIIDYISDSDFIKLLDRKPYGLSISSIIHFGAISSTTETDFKLVEENNFRYSKNLAKFCKLNKIPFIYASSAATYGNCLRFSDSMTPNECSPINIYSFFKNLFDNWIIDNKVPALCLKYFNVFGPNEYHKRSMISFILRCFYRIYNLESREITIYKDDLYNGEMKRDFIYIKDAIKMTYFLVKNNKIGTYNIGTGISTSWVELFNIIKKITNLDIIPVFDTLKFENGYQYFTQANINKIIMEGYPEIIPPLEDRIRDYYENYLYNDKLYLTSNDDF